MLTKKKDDMRKKKFIYAALALQKSVVLRGYQWGKLLLVDGNNSQSASSPCGGVQFSFRLHLWQISK